MFLILLFYKKKKLYYFRLKLFDINHFLSKRNIPRPLIGKVHKYLEFANEEEFNGYKRGSNLVHLLSEKLKSEISIETYYKFLRQVKCVSKNLSEEFLKKLCTKMSEEYYGPNEIVNLVIKTYVI